MAYLTREILKIVVCTIVLVLVIDFVCLLAWVASGQVPADSFYAGTISAHIIKWVAGL